MGYVITIVKEDKEIKFEHKELCNAIVAIENAAETVEGFDDGITEIRLKKKIIKPLTVGTDKGHVKD